MDLIFKFHGSEVLQLEKFRAHSDYELIIKQSPDDHEIAPGIWSRRHEDLLQPISLDEVEQVIKAATLQSNGWLPVGTKLMKSKAFC